MDIATSRDSNSVKFLSNINQGEIERERERDLLPFSTRLDAANIIIMVNVDNDESNYTKNKNDHYE